MNRRAYWENRFRANWQEFGGPEQTLFFARLFVDSAPQWFRRLAATRAESLIDIGCAEGQGSDYLKAVLGLRSALGVDGSQSAIETARESFPDCRFSVVDLQREPLEPADIVYCSNVLQLFEERDHGELLGKVIDAANLAAALLVPLSDDEASGEQESTFSIDTLPFWHRGAHLGFARVVDAAELSHTSWFGKQLLVIYLKFGIAVADLAAHAGAESDGYGTLQLHKALELKATNQANGTRLTVKDLIEASQDDGSGDERSQTAALVLDRMLGLETFVRTADGRWRLSQQEATILAERLERLGNVPSIQAEFGERQQRLALQQAEGFEHLRLSADSSWREVQQIVERKAGQLAQLAQDLGQLRQTALRADDRAQAQALMLQQLLTGPEGVSGLREQMQKNADGGRQTAELLGTVLARLEERHVAEERHRGAIEELNSRLDQAKLASERLDKQRAGELETIRAQAASAEQDNRVLREQRAGLEELRSNEVAQARQAQIELSALRRKIGDLESTAHSQRNEIAGLSSDLRLTVVALEAERRARREQAWRYKSDRIGFRITSATHRALDLIQAATPEIVRRGLRGAYLPLYRRVFPEGQSQFEKPDFAAPQPESVPVASPAIAASEVAPIEGCQPSLPNSGAPRVSVIVPVWNHADLLGDALLSVLGQSYSDLEVIVVDDGSTDNIGPIVQAFSDDPRVIFVRRAHEGLPQALNAGFRVASGDLWTWSSADNLMHPEMISNLVEFMRRNPDVDMTFANMDLISESGLPLIGSNRWAVFQNPEATNELLLPADTTALGLTGDNFIGACFLYRDEIGRLLNGYDESLIGVEDYDFWLRLSEFGNIRHLGLDQPFYHYRVHPRTLSEERQDDIRSKREALIRSQRERVQNYRRRLNILLLTANPGVQIGRTVGELRDALNLDGHRVDEITLVQPAQVQEIEKAILDWHGSLEPDSWRIVVCFVDSLTLAEALRAPQGPQTVVVAWVPEPHLASEVCIEADWILTDVANARTQLPQVKRGDWSQLAPTTVSTEFDLSLCLKAREGRHHVGDWPGSSAPVFLYLGPTEEPAVDWRALTEAIDSNPLSTFLIVSTDGAKPHSTRLLRRANLKYLGSHPVTTWYRFISRADVLLAPFAAEPAKRAAFNDTLCAYLCAGKPVLATSEVRKLGFHSAPSIWVAGVGEFGETARSLLGAKVDIEAVDRFRKTRSVRRVAKDLASAALIRLERRNKPQSPSQGLPQSMTVG